MQEELKNVIHTLQDHKAEDICYFDISSKNPLCDYYVICTANSTRHALSLADYVEETLAKNGQSIRHIEGNQTSNWILVDAYDIVIHLFVRDARNFYGLEKLWSDLNIYRVD